jgi:signal transduction histidine kinase
MSGLRAIMKTTAARLSALYLLLFAACALLLVMYMTSLSVRNLVSQTRETINEEINGLDDYYQRGGFPLLVRVIERRSHQPGANLYLIADGAGQILAGNVESLAPGVLDNLGWTREPFTYKRYGESQTGSSEIEKAGPEERVPHLAIARVIRIPNGMRVLIGRDLGEPERFRRAVRNSLVLALGTMAVGGFLIWFFVGRRALKRIDAVSVASRRIMGGDLTGRLPVNGSGDEFDRLSVNLNSMLDRIAELNEGLKHVSDNIAHDLKTPLTRLRNRAEAALSGRQSADAYRDAIQQTIADSDQIIRTFNAILMISRLESGYSSEQTGNIDLPAIVEDVFELYEPLAEEAGITLEKVVNSRTTIIGNRELVGQALSNVIDNAIKYCTAENCEPKVAVSLEDQGDWVVLSVVDNGPGISDDDKARATERFVRLEESRSEPGSGLGLSLVKAVMKLHKGELRLGNADPGLQVQMRFPRAESDG